MKCPALCAGLVGLLHSSCCHGPSSAVAGDEPVLHRFTADLWELALAGQGF